MPPLDLGAHRATAAQATPGPWQWFGNTRMYEVYLATVNHGRVFVMDFARWGMRGAQPRFQVRRQGDGLAGGVMHTLGDLAHAASPLGPKFEVPYRRQFQGIGHPDAAHIAANDPTTVQALISRIEDLERVLGVLLDSNGAIGSGEAHAILARGIVLP